MAISIFDDLINKEIDKYKIAESVTSYLVKKKKRGTSQALEESTLTESEVREAVKTYITNWIIAQFFEGTLNQKFKEEIKNTVYLELVRKGFQESFKD
jgi:hypothetical protein